MRRFLLPLDLDFILLQGIDLSCGSRRRIKWLFIFSSGGSVKGVTDENNY
jgi:hypothetical protein